MSRHSVEDADEIITVNHRLNIPGSMGEEPQKEPFDLITSPLQQEKITYSHFVAIQNSPFVAIQPHGVKPPFYACGHHPRLISLARTMGIDQPFYKMDAYAFLEERLAKDHGIDISIEEMADCFVSEILTSQRVGPYYLGGGCEGAIIAFEIARQLESRGHQIAMLVVWDTPITKYWRNEAARR